MTIPLYCHERAPQGGWHPLLYTSLTQSAGQLWAD